MSDGVPGFRASHGRRLREVWRSAGWPCRDMLELDLLWVALARVNAEPAPDDGQALLGAPPADAL